MSKCHVCGEETNPMPPHRDVVVVDVTTAKEKGVRWGLYHEDCYKQLMKEKGKGSASNAHTKNSVGGVI
jgi:hypothetical protein